jgi:hypothetical protein
MSCWYQHDNVTDIYTTQAYIQTFPAHTVYEVTHAKLLLIIYLTHENQFKKGIHLVITFKNATAQKLYMQFLHTFTSLSDVKFPSALNIFGIAAASVSRTGSSVRRAM